MKKQTQRAINTLVSSLERYEQIARNDLKKYLQDSECGTDRFRAGWIHNIYVFWECFPPQPEQKKTSTKISVRFETNDTQFDYEESVDADLSFITPDTPEILRDDMTPALQAWLHEKVCNEEWGGVFDAKVSIEMNGYDYRNLKCATVQDEKRLKHRIDLIRDFIVKKEYETEDLSKIYYSLCHILRISAIDLYEELGAEILMAFYAWLPNYVIKLEAWDKESMQVKLAEILIETAYVLRHAEGKQQLVEGMFHLACDLCMEVMRHGSEHWAGYSKEALETAAERGSTEAMGMLKIQPAPVPAFTIHWSPVPDAADGMALFALWPSPMKINVCFQEAGFTDFGWANEHWNADAENMLIRLLEALGHYGQPRLIIAPLEKYRPWYCRLFAKSKFIGDLHQQIELPMHWSDVEDCVVAFGKSGVSLRTSDGIHVFWITLPKAKASSFPDLVDHVASWHPSIHTTLRWDRYHACAA
jgi:hypothetical protein